MKIESKRLRITLLLLLAVVGGGLGGRALYKTYRWKRFAVVEEGELYRSGQLYDWQLEEAIERYGLKTLVCLNPDQAEREREICADRDVEFRYFPMPSNGCGKPEYFADIIRLMTDPARRPLLIHCRAGVARTGAAVAMYRQFNGWSYDEALAELCSFERKGRCEPQLRRHITEVFESTILPMRAAQATADSTRTTPF